MMETFLVHRIEALESRLAALESRLTDTFQMPEVCRQHTCSFWTHYLAHGPADLTHEGYHAAEAQCDHAQTADMAFLDSHPNHIGPTPHDARCRYWEKIVRA